ncbi:MAG: protein translocase subunit SecF [Acidobacteria bacterium]|jgi:preprotein translocase subunit SecF|nr:protein translocase subunit SecF [Acidobacteriota bacterium]
MRIKFPRKYDFMGQRAFIAAFVGGGLLLALAAVALFGIQRGVEFTGGAEVSLRYVEAPDLTTVRQTLDAAKLPGVSATTFGDTGGRELAIRVGLPQAGVQAGDKDLATQVVEALKPAEIRQKIDAGMVDLNTADSVTIADRLVADAGMARAEADAAADAILALRRDGSGVLPGLDQVRALPAVPEPAKGWLAQRAFVGPFGLRGQEVIEASISREMRDRAIIASVGALVLMMLYLWIRFSGFKWGLSAMVALAFDVVVTLGLFAAFKEEFTLPVVAAFLTLIGYSVNDKIVVFDRIRELIRNRGTAGFASTVNEALNEVLPRTLITGICTVFTASMLFFFGGIVLHGFSFVLLWGIIIGTLSSLYVACPFVVWWTKWRAARQPADAKAARAAKAAKATGRARA